MEHVDAKLTLYQLIRAAGLNERQLRILILRWGLDGQPGLIRKDIAELVGVSPERVRQIECKAFRKIQWTQAYKTLSRREYHKWRPLYEPPLEPPPPPSRSATEVVYPEGDQIAAICDRCDIRSPSILKTANYMVVTNRDANRIRRFATEKLGWSCTEAGDFCPKCAEENDEPVSLHALPLSKHQARPAL